MTSRDKFAMTLASAPVANAINGCSAFMSSYFTQIVARRVRIKMRTIVAFEPSFVLHTLPTENTTIPCNNNGGQNDAIRGNL